ncbi:MULTISPECIES: hypothetical protein [Streptomyces]|uniref:hypothetical protein n=1 Tax=Streptomyces TaxID=1883 RepID=UPI0006EB9694|nr:MULTISPECIES: hypothetical protein [Streptomyces]
MVRVLVIHDEALIRCALVGLLRQQPGRTMDAIPWAAAVRTARLDGGSDVLGAGPGEQPLRNVGVIAGLPHDGEELRAPATVPDRTPRFALARWMYQRAWTDSERRTLLFDLATKHLNADSAVITGYKAARNCS